MSPTRSNPGICCDFAQTGDCRFGPRCKFSHSSRTPAAPRKKRNKKKVRTGSTDKIDEFFAAYPDFDYDNAAPFIDEFYRMCDFFEWGRDDPARQGAREDFRAAMVQEFNSLYGKDVNDLSAWKALCQIVHISPIPEDIKTCRERVKETHVNLVDLVERARTSEAVRVFPDLEALRQYTIKTRKFFPKENAYAGGVLKYLLREILV